MMEMQEYLQKVYRLEFTTRYCGVPKVREEKVSSHSFFVAVIVLKLADEFHFDVGLATIAAISHDIVESDLGDPTHGLRVRHPSLHSAYKQAEILEIVKYPKWVQRGWYEFESDSVEGRIARLADAIQVQQYVSSEEALGNHIMEDPSWEGNLRMRIFSERKDLNEHRRKTENSQK